MSDPIIQVSFDGQPGISFVQGEDRSLSLAFRDVRNNNAPLDLTGSTITVSLPGANGVTVRRMSGPIAITAKQANVSASTFSVTGHGLVTGDPVTFSPVSASTIPAPLVAGTVYYVVFVDGNTFSLSDTLGNPVQFTSTGSGSYLMANSGDLIVLTPATSGQAMLNLRALVSAAVVTGMAQDFQVGIVNGGKTRVVIMKNELDVYAQPDP